MSDFVDPRQEPLVFNRDPDAPLDPDLNEDLIDSAEADRLAAQRSAEEASADEASDDDDTLGDTQPVDNLE
jgi:hypothetical protein